MNRPKHYPHVSIQLQELSDHGIIGQGGNIPVIIDNMMNLELLFAATQLTGDSSFYKIAVSSCQHHHEKSLSVLTTVLIMWWIMILLSGKVIQKTTHQGYANESAWSRGQAWGLYGYTMCYRFTKDKKYLEQAEKIAAFMLESSKYAKRSCALLGL